MKIMRVLFPLWLAAVALLVGCTRELDQPAPNWDGSVPEGYVRLDVKLAPVNGKVFITRADPDPLLTRIDDVHMLIFQDSNGDGVIEDTDPLIIRNFYEYGVMQNIYLKQGPTYFVYVVANLDDSNCPNGDVDTYFDDVDTYGALKGKIVQFLEKTPRELNKMIMSTEGIVPISLPLNSNVFEPTIILQRVQSKFIVNIYNKVTSQSDPTVASGVFPSTLAAVDMPTYSYVLGRPVPDAGADGSHDYAFTLGENGYYRSQSDFLLDGQVVEYPEGSGNWYTKQTVEFFAFENRRGSNPDINDYDTDGSGPIQNVYGRKALAPDYSTYLELLSLTEGNALMTYVHAGKGRDAEEMPVQGDDITNFDVDRSCVYHFNIVINSVNNVTIDTRREYLNQVVLFNLPDVRRIDAHFIDIPAYISSTTPGYVKLQSGTCLIDGAGNIVYNEQLEPSGWQDMSDSSEDATRWLRFSWNTPYNPSIRPINTSLYVGMTRTDAVTGATPILHFHEYVDNPQEATIPSVPPLKRTAVIRVGFVEGATSAQEYDIGVNEHREAAFYVPISQYGLKTIGQVGGYENGVFTALLGVESVEEYSFRYYERAGFDQDEVNAGPYWRYMTGFPDNNQSYDGKAATQAHYDDYRAFFPLKDDVPPIRWEVVNNNTVLVSGSKYNPQSNTNAADYCMRKNRDEDGNGIIEGDEIKWYLPTPVQVMQMYSWRNAFRNTGGGSYTINYGYNPFGGETNSRYYWTVNEDGVTPYDKAYVVDFGQTAAVVTGMDKTTRNPVRCVRDIPTEEQQSVFYFSEDGHLVANLDDFFPGTSLDTSKPNQDDKYLRENNTLARSFIISRWYLTNNSGSPIYANAQQSDCDSYSETGYGNNWWRPSQQELSFMYAYSGVIETLFEQAFSTVPEQWDTASTFHYFRPDYHWGKTNVGNQSAFWSVDFRSGYAAAYDKNGNHRAYFRCVRYLDPENLPAP